jgi:membrane-associated protease RseP (regulator of RpoE activity)
VLVTEVVPETPAAKAGLESGDVITSVNGKAVSDPDMLRETIRASGVGKQVDLQVMRGGEKKEIKATLEEAPAEFGIGGPQGRYGQGPFLRDPLQALERRIEQLEKRVRELEQKRGQK